MAPFDNITSMSIIRDFFTPKQGVPEPGPPLSVVLHPYYPQSLLLPGYEPLTIPFEHILGIFFGASAVIFIAVWLASGASQRILATRGNSIISFASMAITSRRRHLKWRCVQEESITSA